MDPKSQMESIVFYMAWSHFTIFLFLVYMNMWKIFLKGDPKVDIKSTDHSLHEMAHGASDDLTNVETLPEYLKNYLNSLGSDDFGVNFKMEYNKFRGISSAMLYLKKEDLIAMEATDLHTYFCRVLSYDEDYTSIKLRVPDLISFKIVKKKTDITNMIESVLEVKNNINKFNKSQMAGDAGNMFSELLPSLMGGMNMMDSHQDNINDYKDTRQNAQIEDITELEREMNSIMDTKRSVQAEDITPLEKEMRSILDPM